MEVVSLNVGGKTFTTSLQTLTKDGRRTLTLRLRVFDLWSRCGLLSFEVVGKELAGFLSA